MTLQTGFRLFKGEDINTEIAKPTVTGGSINATPVGATTASTGAFTTLSATGAVSLTNASVSMTAIPTADPHVVGRLWANVGVLTISAG